MKNVLAEKAVLASLSLSRWNGHRIDRAITDKVNREHSADRDAGRYNKKLIATEDMAPVTAAITAARNYHYKMTLPWLDEGARILPSKLFLEYTEEMRTLREGFDKAAREFTASYPGYVKAAQKRLGALFKDADYPDSKEIAKLFAFDVAIFPCPDTEDFRISVGKEHAEDIRQDIARRMKDAVKDAGVEVMQRVAEAVGHMAERLRAYTPPTDKDKASGTFRDSLVENVREIARLLPKFNLADDPAITKITKRIEDDLCQNEPATLREDESARDKTTKAAEEILAQISDFIA